MDSPFVVNNTFGPKVKFDYFCDRVENGLSKGAKFPFFGTIPAVIKIALGTVQLITALALGVLTLPLRFFHEDLASFNDHNWSHVKHGVGNITCGLLEAIPLFGSIVSCKRKDMPYDNVNSYYYFIN